MRLANMRRTSEILGVFRRHGFGGIIRDLRRGGAPVEEDGQPEQRPSATSFREALEELGPFWVKLGQKLSLRGDLLPTDYLTELQKLQSDAPPVSWETVAGVVEQELGSPVGEVFAGVDPNPLGSASLAQTHAATLHDGTRVVVKVQRPGVEETIRVDLSVLRDLAVMAQRFSSLGQVTDLPEAVDEFAISLNQELDYRREGRNTERFAAIVDGMGVFRTPSVYWDLTTSRVLVIERFDGYSINDLPALERDGHDRIRLSRAMVKLSFMGVLGDGWFHGDPHPGNVFVLEDGQVGLIDFGYIGFVEKGQRFAIARLWSSWREADVQGITDAIELLGTVSPRTDRRELESAIRRLVGRYGSGLEGVGFGLILVDVVRVAQENRIRVPANLVVLGNAFVMGESVAKTLDPNLDLAEATQEDVRRFTTQFLRPESLKEVLLQDAMAWGELGHELPRRVSRILRRMDETPGLRLPDVRDAAERANQIAHQLSVALLVSALVIGLAIVSVGITTGVLDNLILGVFIAVAVGAILLAVRTWRSRRSDDG
jgi:ubiquinone biosynthesis protein